MSPLIAVLRIARRDAWRHKWRSLLVVVLILVPVAAATGVDVVYRTIDSTEAQRERTFGRADAAVHFDGYRKSPATQEQVLAALPAGSRWIPSATYSGLDKFTAPGRVSNATVLITDHVGDPLLRHRIRLVAGVAPKAGNEAAVSPGLAKALGIDRPIGATLTSAGTTVRIVGVVRAPDCLNCATAAVPTTSPFATGSQEFRAYASPAVAAESPGSAQPSPSRSTTILVDFPAGFVVSDYRAVPALAQLDVTVEYRALYGFDYAFGLSDLRGFDADAAKGVALASLVAGLGLLEIVLLAGTAFAVGARRQTRTLGLLGAQGAAPAQVRQVVLAQGALLGAVGAVLGVAAGFGTTAAARPILERVGNSELVGFSFGWLEIGFAAFVGVASGIAAALVPALRAARRPAVDALAGRFVVGRDRSRRQTRLGLGLLGLSGLMALAASLLLGHGGAWFAGPADYFRGGDELDGALLVLSAVFVAVAGLLLVAPALLGLLARLGARLPVTARIASRDAHRHAHRIGPAMSAIAVSLGIAVGASCLIATAAANDRELPPVPDRAFSLDKYRAVAAEKLDEATAAVVAAVPGSRAFSILEPAVPQRGAEIDSWAPTLTLAHAWDDRTRIGVADADLVVLASGRQADRATAAEALAAGKAVVFGPAEVAPDGTVGIASPALRTEANPRGEILRLPAVVLPRLSGYDDLPSAFVGPQVVAAQSWPTEHRYTVIAWEQADPTQVAAARTAADNLGFEVRDSGGGRDVLQLLRFAIGAAALLIGLFGVAVSVALATAEGRPDLATLAAVGATPGRRRRVGAANALVPAGLGTALGLALGYYFGRAALGVTNAPTLLIPWSELLPVLAAMPILAALVGVAGSLGRTPLTRRVD